MPATMFDQINKQINKEIEFRIREVLRNMDLMDNVDDENLSNIIKEVNNARSPTFVEKERKKAKKSKSPKDPNKPKRPQNAYMLWFNQEGRNNIKDSTPDAKPTEIAKLASPIWENMIPKEKKKWEKKSINARAQYAKDIKLYNDNKEEED
tara:strand:- start:943 stop:1395 length:453 start_codon:yes stop_codon:yes gene_type:complete